MTGGKRRRASKLHLPAYCPPGQGKVDVPPLLNLMNGRKIDGMIMIELNNDPRDLSAVAPYDLAKQSVTYLKSIGVRFRS